MPFTGTVVDVLQQHLSRPAPVLRVLGEHLDTTLSRSVARCLAKDPNDRFQTAADLATALSRAPELRRELAGEYWIVDLDARLIERWRPDDERPEILTGRLVWHPAPARHPPFELDLEKYFEELGAE